MKNKKRASVLTSTSLQKESEAAITAFKNLIEVLKATNDQANEAMETNNKQIEALRIENEAIAELAEKNSKIVHNIENLIVV